MITTNHPMHSPAHPGVILGELYLKPLGITITKASQALGVSRKHLSAVLNGRSSISPEMAVRLAEALSTGPEIWLDLQVQYDLWKIMHGKRRTKVEVLRKKEPA